MRAALLTAALLVAFAIPAVAQTPSGQRGQHGYQGNPGHQNDQDDYGPPMWRGGGSQGWGDWHDRGRPWADMHRRFGPERFH